MLSKADIAAISDLIDSKIPAPVVTKEPETTVVSEASSNTSHEEDPGLESLFKTQEKLQAEMADPKIVIMRGRRGSVRVNQTLENLNAVNDMIKDRKTWKTSTRF